MSIDSRSANFQQGSDLQATSYFEWLDGRYTVTLLDASSSHLKINWNPKGHDIFQLPTIDFQGRTVIYREATPHGISHCQASLPKCFTNQSTANGGSFERSQVTLKISARGPPQRFFLQVPHTSGCGQLRYPEFKSTLSVGKTTQFHAGRTLFRDFANAGIVREHHPFPK